jgi:UDP-3-O-[3-hydroxymyristoyl] glucosamine N-acyltransferase
VSGGLQLDEIVARLGGVLQGDGSLLVSQVGSLLSAGAGQIAFIASAKYREQLQRTQAAAVIVPPQFADDTLLPRIVHPNPYAYYARVVALLNPAAQGRPGVHPGAVVHSPLPASVSVGENAVVGEDVRIGENVTLYPGCVLGDGVRVGDDSVLYANVVVYDHCVIGRRAIIHAGAVIGADGFGFARDGERWIKIPQIGRVLIGDDVEVGANTTIDRGALDDTVIGNGVKLDNLIQIAHNVRIGEHTAMAACTGVAGSTHIGRRCMIGGSVNIMGHSEIADDVIVSAVTFVSKSITDAGVYTGSLPSMEHREWSRNFARIRQLDSMADRLRSLERQLASPQSIKED